jgi:DNA-binding NtrC family response regulator
MHPSSPSSKTDPVALQTILVVDDNELNAHQTRTALRGERRSVFVTNSAREALAEIHEIEPDIILLSLELPDLPGCRAIDVFSERTPGIPILCLSENPTVRQAVEAIQHGAVDYIKNPTEEDSLRAAVQRASLEARSSRELQEARKQVRDRFGFSHMLTRSPLMLRVFDQVRAVAGTDATVLIRGETGTGKELITRAIHERSRRKDRPFISVNCGAFTESLLESELFGHEKGSFTGASGRRQGVFEMADGGTLFLDELGETSLNVQMNLLRVLEEMEFRRVGGHDPVRVNVRILAATNVDLEEAVEKNHFRQDLFYRLNVFPIFLPPLRSRPEDIPLLMRHFLDDAGKDYELDAPIVTKAAMDSIIQYAWPGNVRQLRSLCERWVITRPGQRLEREHLPPEILNIKNATPQENALRIDESRSMSEVTERLLHQVERTYIQRLLKKKKGHLAETAKAAGITRRTLYSRMKLYGIDAADFRG